MAVSSIMTSVMNNPTVLAVGIAVGFLLGKIMGRKRRGGMGGGGMF